MLAEFRPASTRDLEKCLNSLDGVCLTDLNSTAKPDVIVTESVPLHLQGVERHLVQLAAERPTSSDCCITLSDLQGQQHDLTSTPLVTTEWLMQCEKLVQVGAASSYKELTAQVCTYLLLCCSQCSCRCHMHCSPWQGLQLSITGCGS